MAKKWKLDREWMREMLKGADGAADWPPEKTAAVEERLRRILLETLAEPPHVKLPYYVGNEACQVIIAMEAAKQERELAELAERRRQIVVTVNY